MNNLPNKLTAFLKQKNNRFKNEKGMEIGLTEGNELWTYFCLCNHDFGPLAISISTDEDNVEDFIHLYKIQNLEDIYQLEYNNAWCRYLNGYAYIEATPFELEATLCFRICGRKTIVYSLELHYYDEVYEHLTMVQDFENYVTTRKNRLSFAGENRYKINRK